MKKTAIIVGDSFNNTLGLIRSLGQAHVNVLLIIVGEDRLFVSKSKYTQKVIKADSLNDCDAIFYDLKSQYDGATIICSNDKAAKWVDDHEAILSANFRTPMQGKSLNTLFDKAQQIKLALEFGITTPISFLHNRANKLPSDIKFPLLIKPANSNNGSKSDIHICQNIDQFTAALSISSECNDFICQEYINKDFEINMIGISTDNGVYIPGGIKKIRHYPTIYSPCSFGQFLSAETLEIDTEPIKRMISSIGYRGPFSVEFLRSNGRSYFMEVNFRHDGLAYAATSAGVNLLEYYFSDTSIEYKVRPTYMMDLSTDYCHVKDGEISKKSWIKDFLRTRCQLNFNWRDPMPTICYYRSKLLK